MVFNVIWYTTKAILAILHWRSTTTADGQQSGAQTRSAVDTTMRVAARPPSDVKKLFIAFAISFTIIHQWVLAIMKPAAKVLAEAEGKTCVRTAENNFFCSDDPKEIKKRVRKTAQYYLQNFGVAQTIDGSGEENMRMRAVHSDMEQYFEKWIDFYEHVEVLKEKCVNNHDKCVFWASIMECQKNPGYMDHECMLACQKCEKLLEMPDRYNVV